ncbi:MAG: YIP1 family protein [Steroidobacteraceae bacterium]
MNNLALVTALFTEPARAFEALAVKPRWAFPLVVTLFATAGLLGWYYARVDMTWLVDTTLRANPRVAALSEAQLEQMIQRASGPAAIWLSLVSALVFVLVMRLLEAVWYLLAGKVTNVERSFRQWFALACWTGLPQVVAALAAVPVLLMTTTTQLDSSAIAPLSLNELFFHRKLGDPAQSFLVSINLMHLAGLALAVYGVRQWSRRSWLYASLFVLLPPLLIFGTWGYFALGRA